MGFWCEECTLNKFIGLLLTPMASRNCIHSALVQAEKGNMLGLDIVSQEKLPHTLMPVLHPHIVGTEYAVPFLLGHPVLQVHMGC